MKKTAREQSSKKSTISSMSSSPRKTRTIDLYVGTNHAGILFDTRTYPDEVVLSLFPLKPEVNYPDKWESTNTRIDATTYICISAAKRLLGGKIPPKNVQWNFKMRLEDTPKIITPELLKKRQLAAKRRKRR